jgi:RHS repeat-associated protein
MTARQQVIRWLGVAAVVLGGSPAAGQTVEYYHLDALGSVRAITNQAGQIIERHDYLPFGEEWNPQPSTDARKFTGKERDPETGYDYFGARYLSTKTARFTTVDPLFTLAENLADPQRWNRYSYVRNNPLRYTDSDGRAIDILADIGFIAYDLFDIGRSIVQGDGVTGTQVGALGADVLGAAVPFATGGGAALRAANKVETVVEAGRRGRQSELRLLQALGETKNTKKVRACEGCSVPDYQNATTIGEIKDAKRIVNSRQLRIQREAAASSGREHVVHAGANAQVSRTVQQQSTVRRTEDLGPK